MLTNGLEFGVRTAFAVENPGVRRKRRFRISVEDISCWSCRKSSNWSFLRSRIGHELTELVWKTALLHMRLC
jgi:hypothetical protein